MTPEKDMIIARMAAVRARLLYHLLNLDEHTLTSARLYGDWTAANLLAHLGEYDTLYTQMVRDALSGELLEKGVDYSDIRDHLLPNRVGGWSLEQSVSFFQNARSEFVEVFLTVPDEQLKTKQRFNWKFGHKTGRSQGMIGAWGQARFKHDAGHMDDLVLWRKTLVEQPLPPSKVILVAALEAAHDDFFRTAALVPIKDRDRVPVCGDWTLKDVMAHLADWDDWFLNRYCAMIGEPTSPLSWTDEGSDTNERLVAFSRKQSFAHVWEHNLQARSAIISELLSISDDLLADPYGGEHSDYPSAYHCIRAALEHYLDHAAVIRRELNIKFPKYLLQFKGRCTT